MSKSLIKKEDVANLLETIADNEGYIEKGELLVRIRELDTYSNDIQPIDTLPIKNARNEVYHISDHIQAINKYQHKVKTGAIKSYVCLYLQKHFGIEISDKKLNVKSTGSEIWIKNENGIRNFIANPYRDMILSNYSIAITENELIELLNIAKGTVNSWKKKGIIKQYNTNVSIMIDNITYKYRGLYFKFYDLEDIKRNLSDLK